jgi:hypothetical protein
MVTRRNFLTKILAAAVGSTLPTFNKARAETNSNGTISIPLSIIDEISLHNNISLYDQINVPDETKKEILDLFISVWEPSYLDGDNSKIEELKNNWGYFIVNLVRAISDVNISSWVSNSNNLNLLDGMKVEFKLLMDGSDKQKDEKLSNFEEMLRFVFFIPYQTFLEFREATRFLNNNPNIVEDLKRQVQSISNQFYSHLRDLNDSNPNQILENIENTINVLSSNHLSKLIRRIPSNKREVGGGNHDDFSSLRILFNTSQINPSLRFKIDEFSNRNGINVPIEIPNMIALIESSYGTINNNSSSGTSGPLQIIESTYNRSRGNKVLGHFIKNDFSNRNNDDLIMAGIIEIKRILTHLGVGEYTSSYDEKNLILLAISYNAGEGVIFRPLRERRNFILSLPNEIIEYINFILLIYLGYIETDFI